MNIDELTVGQAKELSGLFGSKGKEEKEIDGGIRIIVLQRGWVIVGRYFRRGTECRAEDSYVIRRWGTTNGLGELATKGPLTDTKLEPSGLSEFHRSAEVLTLRCEESKWVKACPK